MRSGRCEHIILPTSSTAIFSVLIKKRVLYMLDSTTAWLCSDVDKIPVLTINFLNDDFKGSKRYPCLGRLLESRLALRIKHSYEERARAYRIG